MQADFLKIFEIKACTLNQTCLICLISEGATAYQLVTKKVISGSYFRQHVKGKVMYNFISTSVTPRLAMPARSMRVRVYKNLHRSCYSVMALEGEHKGKVIAYADSIVLTDVIAKVSEAGRQRVIREKRKNVHAFIEGDIRFNVSVQPDGLDKVSYNPYKAGHFYFKKDSFPYYGSNIAVLDSDGILIAK